MAKALFTSFDKYKGIEQPLKEIKAYIFITCMYGIIIQCILQFIAIPKVIKPIEYINNIPNEYVQCNYDGKTYIVLIVHVI